jgi:hypothetical protein
MDISGMPTISRCSCGREWTGTTQAHCRTCHEQFSAVANFDLHGVDRRGCPDPATRTRKKRDGTVVRVLKPIQSVHGRVWVGWGDDPRYAEEAVA